MSGIRRYLDYLYRDPLLMPSMLDNTRVGTPITLHNTIDINVEGDDLLQAYIRMLDEEIFADSPEGLSDIAQAIWEADDWKELCTKMFDETRKHGWCVVQFYDEDSLQRWRIFSVQQFTDWVKEPYEDEEGNQKIKAVGVKFEWGDYLGNAFKEELLFDDPFTHLIKFREGDGMHTFAFPDLTQAIMSLAFEIRQIKGQLTFSAAKPSYQHFIYGEAADPDTINDLDSKIKAVDATTAIGAPEKILQEIRTIKNENLDIIDPALDKMMCFFSGVTRLPISYYTGKNENSGLSDVGTKMEQLQVLNKKLHLFKRYEPYIKQMFDEVYGITIEDLELTQDITLDEIEEDDDNKNSNYTQMQK